MIRSAIFGNHFVDIDHAFGSVFFVGSFVKSCSLELVKLGVAPSDVTAKVGSAFYFLIFNTFLPLISVKHYFLCGFIVM